MLKINRIVTENIPRLSILKHSFKYVSEALANKAVYEHFKDNASTLALDISLVKIYLIASFKRGLIFDEI